MNLWNIEIMIIADRSERDVVDLNLLMCILMVTILLERLKAKRRKKRYV